MTYGIFEAASTDTYDADVRARESRKALDTAIFEARKQFGDFLASSEHYAEFDERLALAKPDLMKVVGRHLDPVSGVMNQVVRSLKPDLRVATTLTKALDDRNTRIARKELVSIIAKVDELLASGAPAPRPGTAPHRLMLQLAKASKGVRRCQALTKAAMDNDPDKHPEDQYDDAYTEAKEWVRSNYPQLSYSSSDGDFEKAMNAAKSELGSGATPDELRGIADAVHDVGHEDRTGSTRRRAEESKELIPKGDFDGYLDEVSDADESVKRNFEKSKESRRRKHAGQSDWASNGSGEWSRYIGHADLFACEDGEWWVSHQDNDDDIRASGNAGDLASAKAEAEASASELSLTVSRRKTAGDYYLSDEDEAKGWTQEGKRVRLTTSEGELSVYQKNSYDPRCWVLNHPDGRTEELYSREQAMAKAESSYKTARRRKQAESTLGLTWTADITESLIAPGTFNWSVVDDNGEVWASESGVSRFEAVTNSGIVLNDLISGKHDHMAKKARLKRASDDPDGAEGYDDDSHNWVNSEGLTEEEVALRDYPEGDDDEDYPTASRRKQAVSGESMIGKDVILEDGTRGTVVRYDDGADAVYIDNAGGSDAFGGSEEAGPYFKHEWIQASRRGASRRSAGTNGVAGPAYDDWSDNNYSSQDYEDFSAGYGQGASGSFSSAKAAFDDYYEGIGFSSQQFENFSAGYGYGSGARTIGASRRKVAFETYEDIGAFLDDTQWDNAVRQAGSIDELNGLWEDACRATNNVDEALNWLASEWGITGSRQKVAVGSAAANKAYDKLVKAWGMGYDSMQFEDFVWGFDFAKAHPEHTEAIEAYKVDHDVASYFSSQEFENWELGWKMQRKQLNLSASRRAADEGLSGEQAGSEVAEELRNVDQNRGAKRRRNAGAHSSYDMDELVDEWLAPMAQAAGGDISDLKPSAIKTYVQKFISGTSTSATVAEIMADLSDEGYVNSNGRLSRRKTATGYSPEEIEDMKAWGYEFGYISNSLRDSISAEETINIIKRDYPGGIRAWQQDVASNGSGVGSAVSQYAARRKN